jgi:hypothetical protein
MKGFIIRKIFVALIILIPVFSSNSCDKQEKCGCDGDILFSLDQEILNYSQIIPLSNGATMRFQVGYETYDFCNPVEMYAVYLNLDADEQVQITGDVYWDCSYVSSASQSSYYNYYKYYNIHVTELKSFLYGK